MYDRVVIVLFCNESFFLGVCFSIYSDCSAGIGCKCMALMNLSLSRLLYFVISEET